VPKKAQVDDIVEIRVTDEYSYGQLTHRESKVGFLIAVFRGIYKEPQADLEALAQSEIQFRIFYFAQAALNSGLAKIVGDVPVRDDLKEFPVFKMMNIPKISDGKVIWRLWFGRDKPPQWIGPKLTAEQKEYPV
jgi:hypothetical protein